MFRVEFDVKVTEHVTRVGGAKGTKEADTLRDRKTDLTYVGHIAFSPWDSLAAILNPK